MKIVDFTRSSWRLLTSPSGRWLVLFSLGIGLSLLWTYVPLFLAPLGVGLGAVLFDSPAETVAYFAVCAGVFALHPLVKGRLARFGFSRFGVPQVAAGVAGGALLGATTLADMGALDLPLGCAGAACAAYSSVCAVLTASRLLKRLSPARAIVACMGAFVVAAALTVLAAFLHGPVACALMAAVPAATWVLSRMGDARIPFADLSTGADGRSLTLIPFRTQDAWRYGAITLGIFLMGVWLLGNAGQYDHLPQDLPAWWVALQSVLVVVAFALVSALLQSQPRPLGYDLICRVCVPAVAVGLILIFLPEGNAGRLDDAAVCLTFVALMTCELMVWVIDVCAVRGGGEREVAPFSVVRAGACAGVIAATVVVNMTWAPLDKPKVAMTIALLMLIVTIVCLPGADAKVMPATGSTPRPLRDLPADTRERWSAQIVAHGLTAREAEVFALLMGDLDAAAIAAELGVSGATVHTHVQHVYAKFDVHSRKELERAVRAG